MKRTNRWAGGSLAYLLSIPLLLGGGLAAPDVLRGQASELQGADRLDLNPPPKWSVSGAWSQDGRHLLLVDAFRSQILEYRGDGSLVQGHEVPLGGTTVFSRPSTLKPRSGGFLVEQEDAAFVFLDPDLTSQRETDLLAETLQSPLRIASVFSWTLMGGEEDQLLLLGDVQLENAETRTGFLRVPLDDPGEAELLFELEDDEAVDYYLLGHQYMTSLGGKAYLVEMTRSPSLVEVTPEGGVRRLEVFPEGFELRPYLPNQGGLDQIPAMFAAVERSRMVAGLYAWEGHLYLLTREPVADGCRWTLLEIDPARETIVQSFTLPTSAPHLTVVPGPESWAFLERGRVTGFGQQEVHGVVLMPSDRLRGEGRESGVPAVVHQRD